MSAWGAQGESKAWMAVVSLQYSPGIWKEPAQSTKDGWGLRGWAQISSPPSEELFAPTLGADGPDVVFFSECK